MKVKDPDLELTVMDCMLLSIEDERSWALTEAVTSGPVCTNDCEEILLPVSMPDVFPKKSEEVPADDPEDTLTWAMCSLIGDEDPAWPAWAACAGRHTIRIPSARIRNIRPNSPFIQVHYAEKLLKYNLIAAADMSHPYCRILRKEQPMR